MVEGMMTGFEEAPGFEESAAEPVAVLPRAEREAGSEREAEDLRTSGSPVAVLRYTHKALMDLMIAHPEWTQGELAREFGYSQSWISQIISSDAFQAQLMARHAEVCDPVLAAAVESRLRNTMARSLELLHKKLAKDDPPDNLVLRSLELSSRALGYGAREQTAVVQQNVNEHLERLANRMTTLLANKREGVTIDQQPAAGRGQDIDAAS